MKTSIQLYAEINALKADQAAVPDDAPDRHERLFTIQGRLNALNDQLGEALQAEADSRASFGGRVDGSHALTPTMQLLGTRASFKGIQPGFRAAVTIPANPGVTDPTVPAFGVAPRGFADTLQQGTTDGNVAYLRRGAKINAAAQWKDADGDKPESSYVWTEQNAPLAWIAHHTPITKTEASDWGMLDNTIRGELLLGLAQAKSAACLTGANPAGITGITNTVGIQTHTVAVGDNIYDAIRRMVTKVRIVSGFPATHVALSPQLGETLDLLKDDNKAYLKVKDGGRVWTLEVVEDLGLAIHDPAAGVTHHGMIVYSNYGATLLTKERDNVEMGLVDDQFIKNAYTLLAEGRYALQVRYPDAFCYCEDAIAPVADAS